MTRPIPLPKLPSATSPDRNDGAANELSRSPHEAMPGPAKLPRATELPDARGKPIPAAPPRPSTRPPGGPPARSPGQPPARPAVRPPARPALGSSGTAAISARTSATGGLAPQRSAKLPYMRHEIVGPVDERSHAPAKLARATAEITSPAAEITGPPAQLPEPARVDSAKLPAVDLELAPLRTRARGTPPDNLSPGEQIRTLVFAPESTRASWIERELSHAPITIQVGRSIRTIVAALLRDPPPRPQILIIDLDAISPAELLELHAIREDGWFGRLIALGTVSDELRRSLGIDHVIEQPLIRDSLLDCVAGTRHAAVTTACPVMPKWDDHS